MTRFQRRARAFEHHRPPRSGQPAANRALSSQGGRPKTLPPPHALREGTRVGRRRDSALPDQSRSAAQPRTFPPFSDDHQNLKIPPRFADSVSPQDEAERRDEGAALARR